MVNEKKAILAISISGGIMTSFLVAGLVLGLLPTTSTSNEVYLSWDEIAAGFYNSEGVYLADSSGDMQGSLSYEKGETSASTFYYSVIGSEVPIDATTLVLPSQYNDGNETFSVTAIGDSVFKDEGHLVSFYAPSFLSEIGEMAFSGLSKLKTVSLATGSSNDFLKIDDNAFSNNPNLTKVLLPKNKISLKNKAFFNCPLLNEITLENTSVTSIGEQAFSGDTALSSLTLPTSLKTLEANVFSLDTSLTTLTFLGTKIEWEAINKDNDWAKGSSLETINCTDAILTI